jgi:hypothetical protein
MVAITQALMLIASVQTRGLPDNITVQAMIAINANYQPIAMAQV